MIAFAIGVWVVMLVVAILNAGFREAVVTPRAGADIGHLVSTGTGVLSLLAVAAVAFDRSSVDHTKRELTVIGVLWVALTVGFEFLFGHFVMGHSWARLLHDYNLLEGRVWVAVPLSLLIAPYLFGRHAAGETE